MTWKSFCFLSLMACVPLPTAQPRAGESLSCMGLTAPPEPVMVRFDTPENLQCSDAYEFCATPRQAAELRIAQARVRRYALDAFIRCGPRDGGE